MLPDRPHHGRKRSRAGGLGSLVRPADEPITDALGSRRHVVAGGLDGQVRSGSKPWAARSHAAVTEAEFGLS